MPRRTSPRERPLLAFDGDCGFCRRWIVRWQRLTGDAVDYRPSQEVGGDLPEVPAEAFARSVVLAEPEGRLSYGAEAGLRTLAAGGRGWPLWLYERVPGFRPVTELAYRLVAAHRAFLSRVGRRGA